MTETVAINFSRTRSKKGQIGVILFILSVLLVIYGTAVFLTIVLSLAPMSVSLGVSWLIIVASVGAGFFYARWLTCRCDIQRPAKLQRMEKGILIGGILFYLFLWALAYIMPDSENDGLWYHNPTLHFWALKGRIHWITVDYEPFWNDLIDYSWNGYMKGVEAVGFLFLRSIPVSRFLNGINLVIIPLGSLGIAALVRFLGGTRRSAILGAVLFLLIPNVICHAANLYIGASVASFYIALFAVTAFTIRDMENGRSPFPLLPALGCALGLAVSAKGTAVILFLLVPGVLAFFWFRNIRRFREQIGTVRRGIVFIGITLLFACLVGGYWYLRNYLRTGTPLYPVGLEVGGATIFPGIEVPFQFPPPDTPLNKHWPQVLRVFYSWLDNPVRWHLALTEVSHNSGGLGLLWLFGCFPALIWIVAAALKKGRSLFRFSEGTASAWLGITVIGLVLFFFMPPRHNHKARYIIWIYGLGLPAFFRLAEKMWNNPSNLFRGLGRIWIVTVLLVFTAEGLYSFGYQIKKISLARQGVREGPFHPSHVFRAAVEPYPAAYFIPALKGSLFQRVLAQAEPVALGELDSFPEQKEIIGHLTQGAAFGKREIYFLDPKTAASREKLSSFLKSRGVNYVIWSLDIPVPEALGKKTVLWERIPDWFYLLVVEPGRSGGGGQGGEIF